MQDPFGRAAILLVESLIHGLVSKSVISVPEAVEIVDIAADVRGEAGAEFDESRATTRRSLALLDSISTSLRSGMRASEPFGHPDLMIGGQLNEFPVPR